MWGLLHKDLKTISLQGRVLAIMVVFYLAFFLLSEAEDALISVVTFSTVLMGILFPITALSYDEKAKWEHYALTMPISRNMLVWSKYLLVLLFLLAGELLLLLVSLFQPEIGPALLVLVPGIVLFLNSILLPVAFKLGVEKSRYITVAIMLLPTLVLLLMEKLGVQPPQLVRPPIGPAAPAVAGLFGAAVLPERAAFLPPLPGPGILNPYPIIPSLS